MSDSLQSLDTGLSKDEISTISKLAAALANDLWDVEAWQALLEFADKKSQALRRQTYERCLKVFPRCWSVWLRYLRRERLDGDSEYLSSLLTRALPISFDARLWHLHVTFVLQTVVEPSRARLNAAVAACTALAGLTGKDVVAAEVEKAAAMSAHTQAVEELKGAFECAVKAVGMAYHAGPIWKAYVDFLQSLPDSNATESSQKTAALRKVYRRAIVVAHEHIEELWHGYTLFEKQVSQPVLAQKFLLEFEPMAQRAISVAGERGRVWDRVHLDSFPYLPTRKTSVLAERGRAQLEAWRNVLMYEFSNPLKAETQQLHQGMFLVFKQYVSYATYCVDAWHDFATFLSTSDLDTAVTEEARLELVLRCYEEATQFLPNCSSLAACASDFCELRRQHARCTSFFDQQVDRLLHIIDRGASKPLLADGDIVKLLASLDTFETPGIDNVNTISVLDFPRADDVADAKASLPNLFIVFMRVARRVKGIDAARAVFKVARESPYCTPEVYLAAAQMEYYGNRALTAARNIIELGRKRYSHVVPFLLAALDFIASVDDSTNVRSMFEAVLSELSHGDPREIYDKYLDYELRCAQGGGSLQQVQDIETRRASAITALTGTQTRLLTRQLHRYEEFNMLPRSRSEIDFLIRHPYRQQHGVHYSNVFTAPETTGDDVKQPKRTATESTQVVIPASVKTFLSRLPAYDEHAAATVEQNLETVMKSLSQPPPSAIMQSAATERAGDKRKATAVREAASDEAAKPPAKRRGVLAFDS